jgi:hypothetical protein
MNIEEKILADQEYWKQYEKDNWVLVGFTERDSALFRNTETGRHITVSPDYLAFFHG